MPPGTQIWVTHDPLTQAVPDRQAVGLRSVPAALHVRTFRLSEEQLRVPGEQMTAVQAAPLAPSTQVPPPLQVVTSKPVRLALQVPRRVPTQVVSPAEQDCGTHEPSMHDSPEAQGALVRAEPRLSHTERVVASVQVAEPGVQTRATQVAAPRRTAQ